MPDHILTAGLPLRRRDHLRAHPTELVELAIIALCALLVALDGITVAVRLPSLGEIPAWVQAILGAMLLVGVALALVGMMWRPRLALRPDGALVARIDLPFAVERLGWVVVGIAAAGMAVAIAQTGPWVLATVLPASWVVQAAQRAVVLTAAEREQQRAAGGLR